MTTRQTPPLCPKKVPAGEKKTIGNILQHQNQLPKKLKTKQAVTQKKSTQTKCKIIENPILGNLQTQPEKYKTNFYTIQFS